MMIVMNVITTRIMMTVMKITRIVIKNKNLCHQVIDAVQLGFHLGSSSEIPRLGLIIGIFINFSVTYAQCTYFIYLLLLFIPLIPSLFHNHDGSYMVS